MKANDIYAKVADQLATAMENADPNDWSLPWHNAGFLPTNASTSNNYHGGNVVALWSAQLEHGYATPYWATYKQWGALGRQVRKGEKATYGVKWSAVIDRKDPEGKKNVLVPNGFTVFNFDQTDVDEDALDQWSPPERQPGPDPTPELEAFVAATGASFQDHDVTSAHYDPLCDRINVPPIERFTDSASYYSTVLHELTHWTGAPDRLDRATLKEYFTDRTQRAREELTAELGAAFLCAELGISAEPRPDHAQYLASWASLLRSDPKAFYTAASAAEKAAKLLKDPTSIEQKVKVAA